MQTSKEEKVAAIQQALSMEDGLLANLAAGLDPQSKQRVIVEITQQELAQLALAAAGAAAQAQREGLEELSHIFVCRTNSTYAALINTRTPI